MNIYTFPHCGRTFVCSDELGILDVRKAIDAFNFALMYGDNQVNAYTRAVNIRERSSIPFTTEFDVMYDEPVVGFSSNVNFYAQSFVYLNRMPMELADSHDAMELTVGFRMMSVEEAVGSSSGLANGQGVRAQRVTMSISNLPNNRAETILDIYYDRAYYLANISLFPASNPYIDLTTMTASGGLTTAGLTLDGHNVITIFKQITDTLRQPNRAVAGALNVSYEFPRDYNGNPWVNNVQFRTNNLIRRKPHPLSGIEMAFTGLNEVCARTFRTTTWTQGTAPVTSTRSRAYAITPLALMPALGDTMTANLHNYQNALANSIQGIGWSSVKQVGVNRGGFMIPLAGFSYRGNDSDQQVSFYSEVPSQATGFMLLAYVRTTNRSGSNQLITVQMEMNGFETLTTTSTIGSGNTAPRWVHVVGSIQPFNLATNGSVNRAKFTLYSEQSVNLPNRVESQIYWDGIQAILIKFF